MSSLVEHAHISAFLELVEIGNISVGFTTTAHVAPADMEHRPRF